LTHRRKKMSK